MPSRFESYRMVDGKTPLAGSYFNPILQELDMRLVGLEELRASWLEAVAQVQELGLARINELVGQPMQTVNDAISEIEQRIAALPQVVSQEQVTQQLQQAMHAEAAAREQLQQALDTLRQSVNQMQGVDVFPPMGGKAGQFLTNDGNGRAWAIPKVTDLQRGTAQPLQQLGIGSDGKIVGMDPVRRLDYSERASLRSLATGTAIVRGLGVFDWDTNVGAADVDDDATLFTGSGGCWRLVAMAPDMAFDYLESASLQIQRQSMHAVFAMTATALASGAETTFNVPVDGLEPGDHLQVTPGAAIAETAADRMKLKTYLWVAVPGVATVAIHNTSTTVATLMPSLWSVLAIKNRGSV